MTIAIRWQSTAARFDGVTDVSAVPGVRYQRDPADDNTFVAVLPPGTNIGVVNPITLFRQLQQQPPVGVGQVIPRSAALQRGFGVVVDDFLMMLGLASFTAAPAGAPTVDLQERDGTDLVPTYTVEATGDPTVFQWRCEASATEPSLIKTGQQISVDDGGEPAQTIELTLYLMPIEDPQNIVDLCKAAASAGPAGPPGPPGPAGPPGPPGTFVQETIAAETVNFTDTTLAAMLSMQPFDVASVALYLNGEFLRQGAGFDYDLSGGTDQSIDWLAGTGTAPNLSAGDVLVAKYNA